MYTFCFNGAPNGRSGEMLNKKHISISLPYAVNIRDLHHSGAIQELVKRDDIELTIYTLNVDLPELQDVKDMGVIIKKLCVGDDSRLEKLLKLIYPAFFYDHFGYLKYAYRGRVKNTFVARCATILKKIVGVNTIAWLFAKLFILFFRKANYKFQIDANTDLAVTTRSTINSIDYRFVVEAAVRKIPTVTIAGSWDNFTTKGFIPYESSMVLVWNKKMSQELSEIFGVGQENIREVGYPRAVLPDVVTGENAETYLASIGVTGHRRFVLYACSYSDLTRVKDIEHPLEYLLVERVCKHINAHLPEDTCVIVRLHPFSDDHEKQFLESASERVRVYVPGRRDSYVERVMDMSEEIHLANQIRLSECVISLASTMSLDALNCQKPVININFDPVENLSHFDSVSKFYNFNHFRDLVQICNLPLAHNEDDVLQFVLRCINKTYEDPVDYNALKEFYVPSNSNEYAIQLANNIYEKLA